MASLRDIKRRIKSVRNIQQITKAMKMVAAARIRRAEQQLKAAKPYAQKLKEVLGELTDSGDGEQVHPLMQARPVKKVALLLVTSDKGLCGAYNNHMLRMFHKDIVAMGDEVDSIYVIGSKGEKFLGRRKIDTRRSVTGWDPTFDLAIELSDEFRDRFLAGEVDEIRCYYTQAVSAMTQTPVVETFLPILPVEKEESAIVSGETLFEPSKEEALGVLLPRYLRNTIYRILMEAKVAELGARLKAMSNATENADKLAGELTLQFYKIRQATITSEILEISNGAEALQSSK